MGFPPWSRLCHDGPSPALLQLPLRAVISAKPRPLVVITLSPVRDLRCAMAAASEDGSFILVPLAQRSPLTRGAHSPMSRGIKKSWVKR